MGGSVMLGVRRNGRIDMFDAGTSQIMFLTDQRVLDGDREAWAALESSLGPHRVYSPVAPDGYGIVFLDMDGKNIWSCQNYTSVTNYHLTGLKIHLAPYHGAPGPKPPGAPFFCEFDAVVAAIKAGTAKVLSKWDDNGGDTITPLVELGVVDGQSLRAMIHGGGSPTDGMSFILLDRPGWSVDEGEGPDDITRIASSMAESGVLSGSAAEISAWDRYCDDWESDSHSPGAAILAVIERKILDGGLNIGFCRKPTGRV